MSDMVQRTLTGEATPIRAPFSSLTDNERIIWNFLNSMQKGYTHDQIRVALAYTGISTFDNRLRDLKGKGWVYTREDHSGVLLWITRGKETAQDTSERRTPE